MPTLSKLLYSLLPACFSLTLSQDDVRTMRDIEQFYNTQIEEMPMNVADLVRRFCDHSHSLAKLASQETCLGAYGQRALPRCFWWGLV